MSHFSDWPWWSEDGSGKVPEEYRVFFADHNGYHDKTYPYNQYWVMKMYQGDPQVALPLNWRMINLNERQL